MLKREQEVHAELFALRQEVATLRSEKEDLETLLELTTEYSDYVAEDLKDKVRITQRKSEERFRMIVETTPVPVIISRLSDAKIMYANTRAASLLGLSREALLRSKALDFYHNPKQRQQLLKQLNQHASVDDYEMQIKHVDGTFVWVSVSLQLMSYKSEPSLLSALHDITERKQAEQVLADYNRLLEQQVAERTRELRQALDNLHTAQRELIEAEKMVALGHLVAGIAHEINTPLGVIGASITNITNTLDETIHQLPRLFQSLGKEEQEDFFALLEQSSQSQQLLSSKEERRMRRPLERTLKAKQVDKARWVAQTLVDMGIYYDIELEPFISLLKSKHSESALQIAYNLSTQQKNSQNIIIAVERASKVVFALKSHVHQNQNGIMMPTNVIDGIEVVLTLYHNKLKQGIEVVRRYQDIPLIPAFADELGQVWMNLIDNAIQAMKNQGQLEIVVFEQEKYIVVQIIDSGPGIPKEILKRIFEQFFTTKPAGEGSGLGLAIVQKIINKHQGKIEVESEPMTSNLPGKTVFTVFLPTSPP